MKMTYNSERPDLAIPEYGRHIQNMVEQLQAIENKEERNKTARAIINVMGQLFPHLRDVEDFRHKLWDHLYIMSAFQLDVDSPYPKPDPAVLAEKPRRLNYPQKEIRFGHYGKIIEDMIAACIKEDHPEKRAAFTEDIANLMKRSYLIWNRDSVKDEMIVKDLEILSKGNLTTDPEKLMPTARMLAQIPVQAAVKNDAKRKRKKPINKKRRIN